MPTGSVGYGYAHTNTRSCIHMYIYPTIKGDRGALHRFNLYGFGDKSRSHNVSKWF